MVERSVLQLEPSSAVIWGARSNNTKVACDTVNTLELEHTLNSWHTRHSFQWTVYGAPAKDDPT